MRGSSEYLDITLTPKRRQQLEQLRREAEERLGMKVTLRELVDSIISEFLDHTYFKESQKEDCTFQKKE